MVHELIVPEAGESIQEVQILKWLVAEGEYVGRDEDLVEVETEKAAQVIPAPEGGIVKSISAGEGEFAKVGEIIGALEKAEKPATVAASTGDADSSASTDQANGSPIVMPAAPVAAASSPSGMGSASPLPSQR